MSKYTFVGGVVIVEDYVDVEIDKPLYGTFCYIRSIYLDKARREKKLLRIKIPQGVGIMSVEEFMDGAKQMKKVFKFANDPMILWGNYVKVPVEKQLPVKPAVTQTTLFDQ